MTSIAAFLAWLIGKPHWVRLTELNRGLLHHALHALVDMQTGALRPLPVEVLICIGRSLQVAEAGISRATWLLARHHAGKHLPLSSCRPHHPLRIFYPRTPATGFALYLRAASLTERIGNLEVAAHRMAEMFVRDGTSNTSPSPALGRLQSVVNQYASPSIATRLPLAHPMIISRSLCGHRLHPPTGPPFLWSIPEHH